MPPSPSSPNTHPAHNLLARAHSPTTTATLFTDKITHKPLLLRASSPPTTSDKRALRRHLRLRRKEYYLRKQKPRPLSAREKRASKIYTLKKEKGECRYEVYVGLNRLWRGYMREVLGWENHARGKVVTAAGQGPLLASADFHGAEVEVVKSRCVSYVGIRGIVVRDTKFTFVLVTKRDEVRTVPKGGSVFRYEIPLTDDKDQGETGKLVFELHGDQFQVRPAERANKKFKWKVRDYL